MFPHSDSSILHRAFPTMSLHPLASRTPTVWPILRLLLMARTIPSTLPDSESGTSLFAGQFRKFFLHNRSRISQRPNHPDLSLGWEGSNRARGYQQWSYLHPFFYSWIYQQGKQSLFYFYFILKKTIFLKFAAFVSSGISTTESPWHHGWLLLLHSSISLRTTSVMMFRSPFPTLTQTKWEFFYSINYLRSGH